jgi:hypothetical protein
MPINTKRKRALDRRWGAAAVAVSLLLAIAAVRHQAMEAEAAEGDDDNVVKEGRLWNIAGEPFKFRLARRTGKRWTDEMTLAPGKFQAIRPPKPGEPSELEGFTGRGDGYVNVSYAALGGHIHLHLRARNYKEELVPYWFHVKDSNGFSRLIQAANIEEAKARQEELQKEEPLTPAEIEKVKKSLKANWVFYEN